MAQAALRAGASLRFNNRVEKVILRDGRAVGVRLQDGSEVEARKVVASNADPRQTFVDLVGVENLGQFRKERLAHWHFGPVGVLATPSFALHEAPDYKSARWDPVINKTFYTVVGFETAEQVSDYILQAHGGAVPERPGAGTWVNSLWDSTQAPPGKHAMNGWFFFPNACPDIGAVGRGAGHLQRPLPGALGAVRAQHDVQERHRQEAVRSLRHRA
jgi:phytoene dehydrogenase-like protein